jgi:hypothetical protein
VKYRIVPSGNSGKDTVSNTVGWTTKNPLNDSGYWNSRQPVSSVVRGGRMASTVDVWHPRANFFENILRYFSKLE